MTFPSHGDPESLPSGSWSAPATGRRVLEILSPNDWMSARVLDVGAGRGRFSGTLCRMCREHGCRPSEHVAACDLIPESFEGEIPCDPIGEDGRLPYPDDGFDAVVSIEVVEHVENQFAFLRELTRVVKPGGVVVVTTPNTLNINSRLRTLRNGFPLLFDPLPLDSHDPRRLGGHIHPVSPYFLAYMAVRAGLHRPTFHPDRTKKSAVFFTIALAPLLYFGRISHHCRLRRKHPDVLARNEEILTAMNGWGMLTCRTTVLRAWKAN